MAVIGQVTRILTSDWPRFSRQQTEEDDDNIVEIVTDNIIETSYHLKTGTIDFLLCDDVATNGQF